MPYVINAVDAPDNYTEVATIKTNFTCVRVNLQVQNNPIGYQLHDPDTLDWGRELTIGGIRGALTFVSLERNCTGIRFHNWLPGQIAVVTAELYLPDELPSSS